MARLRRSFTGAGSGTSIATPRINDRMTAPSGVFPGAALVPVAGVASLSGISVQVSRNRAGDLQFNWFGGTLGIWGALRLKGRLGAGPATLVGVPLRIYAPRPPASAALPRA